MDYQPKLQKILPLVIGGLSLGKPGETSAGDRFYVAIQPETKARICQKLGVGIHEFSNRLTFIQAPEILKVFIEENGIYPASADNYLLEFVIFPRPDGQAGRLLLRYQQIIGSKILADLDAGAVVALQRKLHDLMAASIGAQSNNSQLVAPISDGSLLSEAALLSADGNRIVLPKQHLHHYAEIKRLLEVSGGKYNSKGFFAFADGMDVSSVLSAVREGAALNTKKATQSFFTPPALANEVCSAVGEVTGKRVLEPSAGDGALVAPVADRAAEVVLVENNPANIMQLRRKGYAVIEKDFLTVTPDDIGTFDAIVANPPFSRNQDIDHINHMWKFLKPGGTLSAIVSQSWMHGSQKKQRAFAEFLAANQANIQPIEGGAFKASGTGVATAHIVLKKAA